jgi:hypothetical protein
MILIDPSLTPEERALFERAASWPGCAWRELSLEVVQQLAAREGIDFATALLYHRLCNSDEHGRFIRSVDAMPDTREAHGLLHDVTVAIVPGAFYAEHPETGADGRFVQEVAARMGCRTACVPLLSFGPLRENAGRLLDWLDRQPPQPIVLVSLSKAGAEVRLALEDRSALDRFRHVVAWFNLSGLVRGTAVVDWLFRHRLRALGVRLLFLWNGYSYGALSELERWPGMLHGDFQLPDELLAVHVYGFPLVRHLSRPIARRGHRRLSPLGPNDGGASLLADLVELPGRIYPVWGADHYLQPAWDFNGLLRRLFLYVAKRRLGSATVAGTERERS